MTELETIDKEIADLTEKFPMVKGKRCKVFSRPVGYLAAVDDWNDGKQQEFKDRKTYNLGQSLYNKGIQII